MLTRPEEPTVLLLGKRGGFLDDLLFGLAAGEERHGELLYVFICVVVCFGCWLVRESQWLVSREGNAWLVDRQVDSFHKTLRRGSIGEYIDLTFTIFTGISSLFEHCNNSCIDAINGSLE